MENATREQQAGYTLMEMCVTMAIVVAVGFFGAPNLRKMQERWALQAMTQAAMASFASARLQALKSGKVVATCPSINGRLCDSFSSNARYLLTVDDTTGVLIRSHVITDGFSLIGPASRPRVRFQPNGWAAASNMSLRVCDSRGYWRKDIIINNAGRIRSQDREENAMC